MKGLKLLGKGAFTKAYLGDDERVYLVTTDPVKECMAHGWFPESDLFPLITREENETLSMEYYPKVRSLKNNLDADQWELYQELRQFNCTHQGRPCEAFFHYHKEFDKILNDEVRETLKEALDACGNYGTDVYFEISPRNVATKNGKLILLDCFFMNSALMQVRGK